jgi:microsomal dipeptidase-like Zn-dependent dipeptidase
MFPLCIIALIAAGMLEAHGQVDLHAHLVMKPGMGPALIGDFESPPRSRHWTSRVRTKASRSSLLDPKSPELIVVSLYGHAWLSRPYLPGTEGNVTAALEEEYRRIRAFADAPDSGWVIARSPAEARKALRAGKKVLILSIEGAYGAIRSASDLDRWVERGLAILTPFHLTEDRFGGVALMRPWAAIFNTPFSFLSSWLESGGSCPGGICKSPVGISDAGLELVSESIRKQVWIDFSHASDRAIERLLPLVRAKNLPLMVTHTASREMFPAERGLAPTLIREIREGSDGIVGLIPSEEMIRHDGQDPACRSGVTAFRKAFDAMKHVLGAHRVALGSDANAPLQGLSPPCDSPSDPGYAEYTHLSGLVRNDPEVKEHFLKLWERVRPDPSGAAPIVGAKSPRTRAGNPR